MIRFLPLLLVLACGPVSLAQAERECFERARLATQPREAFDIGIGTDGARARVNVGVSSDYIGGRDPSAVYDQCVQQKSGQLPSRPLYSRPDWKG